MGRWQSQPELMGLSPPPPSCPISSCLPPHQTHNPRCWVHTSSSSKQGKHFLKLLKLSLHFLHLLKLTWLRSRWLSSLFCRCFRSWAKERKEKKEKKNIYICVHTYTHTQLRLSVCRENRKQRLQYTFLLSPKRQRNKREAGGKKYETTCSYVHIRFNRP